MTTVKVERIKGFSIVEGVQIIILVRGIYRQVDVFEKDLHLYAKHSGGYISLTRDGITSVPAIAWKEFVATTNNGFSYSIGRMSWLEIKEPQESNGG